MSNEQKELGNTTPPAPSGEAEPVGEIGDDGQFIPYLEDDYGRPITLSAGDKLYTTPPAPLGGLTEGEVAALKNVENRHFPGSDYLTVCAALRRLTAPAAGGLTEGLLAEQLQYEQAQVREAHAALTEAGAPTNGDEGHGKRHGLTLAQRIRRLTAPRAEGADALHVRADEIERAICEGRMTAAQVFTQMRQLLPQKAAQGGDDARDAARYRMLRNGPLPLVVCDEEGSYYGHDLDAALDAAPAEGGGVMGETCKTCRYFSASNSRGGYGVCDLVESLPFGRGLLDVASGYSLYPTMQETDTCDWHKETP